MIMRQYALSELQEHVSDQRASWCMSSEMERQIIKYIPALATDCMGNGKCSMSLQDAAVLQQCCSGGCSKL